MSRLGRILIVGAKGQLGRDLRRSFADAGDLLCWDRRHVDLTRESQVREMVRAAKPDLILNAAAYTAVDRAESEPDLAMAINDRAPHVLAEEARRRDITLVHYSTDYVFDGTKRGPWVETDQPNPLNVYGRTKLAGEEAVRQTGGKHLIFRTSWVYGPHGSNFMLTMLRLGRQHERLNVVNDQIGAPTNSIELADATRSIVEGVITNNFGAVTNWCGMYHMTCSGSTSWYGFAQEIFAKTEASLNGRRPEVCPIPSTDFPTPATRPMNSLLSNKKLEDCFGVRLLPWQVALETLVKQMGRLQFQAAK